MSKNGKRASSRPIRNIPGLALLAAQTITTAKQQIWVWPTGTIIKLYVFEYCRGSYRDEDGDDHFDYDDGWTASDHLSNGWITLENASHEKQRTIKLSSNALHTWTIHTFSSTEELPRVLKEDVAAHLPRSSPDKTMRMGRSGW